MLNTREKLIGLIEKAKQWSKRDIANGTMIIQNLVGKFPERLMKLHIGSICPNRRKENDHANWLHYVAERAT